MRNSPKQSSKTKLSKASLTLTQRKALGEVDFSYWASEYPGVKLENGLAVDFKDHKYLIEPYQDDHPNQCHKKGTQIGGSTMFILKSIYKCIKHLPLGCIYYFPTDTDVQDFSKGRITPLIQKNPNTIGKYMTDTDTVGLKRVGQSFLYLRGMKSAIRVKSVPADMIVIDEKDEATPEACEMAEKRLSHSKHQIKYYLSNPSVPNYGIDADFQSSDQRFYMLKCTHCGRWNCLEETFPNCLEKKGDVIFLSCYHCKQELDRNAGQWVAKYPSKGDWHGYTYSQFLNPFVKLKDIYTDYNKALLKGRLNTFYNLTLGLAYVNAKDKLTNEQVLECCDPQFDGSSFPGITTLGIDQGNMLHCVLMGAYGKKRLLKPILLKDFEEIDEIITDYNVARVVIDALPETRKAKELANRFPGLVYLNYYVETQKQDTKWDEENFICQENRTESLDSSHNVIAKGHGVLPNRNMDQVTDFAAHCANIAKKLETKVETGSVRYVWVKTGAEHYRHALNYANIAMDEFQGYGEAKPISEVKEDVEKDSGEAITASQEEEWS